jgi:hypothetical protein
MVKKKFGEEHEVSPPGKHDSNNGSCKKPPFDAPVNDEHPQDKKEYNNGPHVNIAHGRGLLAPVKWEVLDYFGSLGRIASGKELIGLRFF